MARISSIPASGAAPFIERALDETIAQLSRDRGTPQIRAILIEARRLRVMVANWRAIPPPGHAQKELFANAMQLFAQAGIPFSRVSASMAPPPPRVSGPPESASMRPPSHFPRPPRVAHLDDPLASEALADDVSLTPLTRPSQVETLPPRGSASSVLATGTTLVRPASMDWAPFTQAPGVSAKLLQRNARTGVFRALVRMEPETELPPHKHAAMEEILVVEGSIVTAGVEARAGDYIFSEPGCLQEPIRTLRGATLFLVGSENDELLGD